MAAAPARRVVRLERLAVEGLGAVEAVGVGVGTGQHQQQFDAPLVVGPAEAGCEAAVDQGAVADLGDLLGVLAAHHGVEAAQDEQRALGVVAAGAGGGELGQAFGAAGGEGLAGVHALPHELHGLEPHPGRPRRHPGGLRLDRADGLLHLVVVQQGLGEADHGVDPPVAVQAGHAEGGAQMADGAGGRGEEGGAAQFVEDVCVHLGAGRFLQGAFQAAAGGVRCADGEVFAGGLAQLPDEFLVVVRVDLEEVAGGHGGPAPGVGDDTGRDAVHGAAQGVRDGVVDGGRDQRVHELQLGGSGGRRVAHRQEAGRAQAFGAAGRLVGAERGELGDQVDGDAVAEDGGRPGEPGGVYAEFLQAGDEAAAAGGAVQLAQFAGVGLDRVQLGVLHLGEELDRLVRVASGDGPHLAAERGVRVLPERGPGQSGRRLGGEGAEVGDGASGRVRDGVQVTGAHPGDLAGAAGDDDQHRQVGEAFGEHGEPVQGLLVGPVGVVDEQHQRPVAAGQPADGGDQALAHTLRVGLPVARVGYAEGGAGDAVPVAQVLAGLLRQHRHQGGLEELPHHVERHGAQGLAAARGPDGAAAPFRDAAGLGEQGGLAQSRLAAQHQQGAGRVAVGAQDVDGLRDGGEFLVALPQGGRGCRRGPCLRHPATSPSRPNDVPDPSVVLRPAERSPVAARVAVTSDTGYRESTRPAPHQGPVGQHLALSDPLTGHGPCR
ncbi:hypothetical protein GCM10010250_65420 [Streptomyces althioticus]|nr:hypothetical protein GCM10010250_65420 [Streptomyces althioticus]